MIFISYRRTDSADVAGRIHDRLVSAFGESNVFKDVDNMPVGTDFAAHVRSLIPSCKVFLALIGRGWLSAQDSEGNRRIVKADDLVRIEIEQALSSPNVLVIPVLLSGASLPTEADLPSSIKGLVARNAAQLRQDPDFNRDISRLIEAVRQSLERRHVSVGTDITVFGIGGAGGNAINNIAALNFEGTGFVALNADAGALKRSVAETLQLGRSGLGLGADPKAGERAAQESRDAISRRLEQTALLLIAAGMGGGTGSGATRVVAELARDLGISTVGVFTLPFDFEGKRRMQVARESLERCKSLFDATVVLENQRLYGIASKDTTFEQAFKLADMAIASALRAVTDLVAKGSLSNVDIKQIASFIIGMGPCSIVRGKIDENADADSVVRAAFANPVLTSAKIERSPRAILNVRGSSDLRWSEIDEVVQAVRSNMSSDARLLTGTRATSEKATGIEFSILGMNSAS